MSQYPSDLPPTMLKATLYTNKLLGNIYVSGNITSNLIFAENLTSNNWNTGGNVSASYFIGNGALLTGITGLSTANARYLSAGRSVDQTITSGVGLTWSNVYVVANTVFANDGISYVPSTGTFTLEAGITYRITSQLNWNCDSSYSFKYNLVYASNGTPVGASAASAISTSVNAVSNNPFAPIIDYIVTPTVNTAYRLRMDPSVTAADGESISASAGTFLTVVALSGGGSSSSSTLPAIGNIDIRGNVTAAGNIVAAGQVNVTGNVIGNYFIGNGSQLTGLTASTLPAVANIDIYGNVVAPGNVIAFGEINAVGNVNGRYITGNGSQLTGVLTALPGTANIDIVGNVSGVSVTSSGMTLLGNASITGNVSGGYFIGNGYYMTLKGFTLIPQGNVANASVRLALNTPVGSLITQEDNGLQYLLTALPANTNSNWLNFTGANFPVTSVFGRAGAISAFPNDYNDSQIQLTANVGTATTVDHVSDALAYLNNNKANVVNGNISANYFIGNGSQLTGVSSALRGTANIDIRGNVTATGNVSANYFIGNGALLTGLPTSNVIYLSAGRSNNQTLGLFTTSWSNQNVIMNEVYDSRNINYNPLTGIFFLVPNVTYRITSQLTWGGQASYTYLVNLCYANGLPLGTSASSAAGLSSTYADQYSPSAPVIDMIVTPTPESASFGTTGYRLKMDPSFDAGTGEFIRAQYGTFLTIVGLTGSSSSSSSFTLPSTGNIDIRGNVTAAGNIVAAGQVNVTGNIVGNYFIGNGALLTGYAATTLPATANIDILGNVVAPGNIIAFGEINAIGNVNGRYFIGNGSQLTGLLSGLPATGNIDIRGNVTASGNIVAGGQVNVTGNVVGNYFVGNGSQLTGVLTALPGTANIDIIGNVSGVSVTSSGLTVNGNASITGNVSGRYFIGNGYYMTLNGFTLTPQGNVANASVRLALNAPVGTLVTQEDNSLQYLLTALPPSSNANWLNFTGANFPVTSVYGRTGAVSAFPNDYNDSLIQLSANVGTATTVDHVSDALAYLNNNKANIVNGNVSARFFLGNGSQLTGVSSALTGTANIDIRGNVTAAGNVSANYFIGNGSQLTGITATATLPTTGNIDITGNVIGVFANVANIIAVQGNVANVRMLGGNIALSGQVNARGNVVGNYFIGNGALLTGITAASANARYLSAGRITNQTISTGNWGNVYISFNDVIANNGITFNGSSITLEGGVTYRVTAQLNWDAGATYLFTYDLVYTANGLPVITGSAGSAENISISRGTNNTAAPVLDLIITPTVTTQYRIRMAGSVTAGTGEFLRADAGTFLTVIGLGNGFDTGLPPTGSIDIAGNVTSGTYVNVTTLLGTFANVSQVNASNGNIGNVRMVGGTVTAAGQVTAFGNVVAPLFIGNLNGTFANVGNTRFLGGNVSVSGQVNVLGNIVTTNFVGTGLLTSNTLSLTGNVVGNLTMGPNIRIFSQQTPFTWNPAVFGSPVIQGNNIFVAAAGNNGTYMDTYYGWRFTTTPSTNQIGSLAWIPGFDFRRDFKVKISFFTSDLTGASWISVGGSTNGFGFNGSNVNNGSLSAFINQAGAAGSMYINAVAQNAGSSHVQTGVWMPLTLSVQTIAGRRYATYRYKATGTAETCADVTSWTPTGSYLVVGAYSNATATNQYLQSITLSYI